MWKPPINFITLHYAYIIALGIIGFIIIYPYGNMPSVDAYFFGVSASTESGLNTIDVKALKTYQQLVIYFIPIIGNLGFINIIVVLVRLIWFEKRLKALAADLVLPRPRHDQVAPEDKDCEAQTTPKAALDTAKDDKKGDQKLEVANETAHLTDPEGTTHAETGGPPARRITFGPESGRHEAKGATTSTQDPDEVFSEDDDEIRKISPDSDPSGLVHRRKVGEHSGPAGSSTALARVASSMFVVGVPTPTAAPRPSFQSRTSASNLPYLSRQATVGRNSQFHRLTNEDRLNLGGIEYRSLRLLLKIVVAYFFGLHIFGAICLVGWIQYAPAKYTDYLQETGQNKIWW